MLEHFTTRPMGDLLGTQEWRIRRLYESRALAEPPRFAGKRMVHRSMIPTIIDALRRRGWLPESDDSDQASSSTGQSQVEQTPQEELAAV